MSDVTPEAIPSGRRIIDDAVIIPMGRCLHFMKLLGLDTLADLDCYLAAHHRTSSHLLQNFDAIGDLLEQDVKAKVAPPNSVSSGGREDGKTDDKRKKFVHLPRNSAVIELAKRINQSKGMGRTKIDIARGLTEGNERRAKSLLRKLRDFPDLLE